MSDVQVFIEELTLPASEGDIDSLADLLAGIVESGAAVSFVHPFDRQQARDWWAEFLASSHERNVMLVARDGEGIVGTVTLQAAWAPNQPHRAEVVKLVVHPRAAGHGLGTRLMQSIEHAARDAGFTLVTLDTKSGTTAERLYRRLGWTHVGTIPAFAVDPDGASFHDAELFFKRLDL